MRKVRPPGMSAEDAFHLFMPGNPPSDDTCWVWPNYCIPNGYGTMRCGVRRRQVYVHRISYLIFNGSIPDGMVVRHSCDNPPCVNPAHLLVGTTRDNIHDCIDRGRKTAPPHRRGADHNHAKLSEADVLEIRRLYATGKWRQVDLAAKYKVRQTNISQIVRRDSWRHI